MSTSGNGAGDGRMHQCTNCGAFKEDESSPVCVACARLAAAGDVKGYGAPTNPPTRIEATDGASAAQGGAGGQGGSATATFVFGGRSHQHQCANCGAFKEDESSPVCVACARLAGG